MTTTRAFAVPVVLTLTLAAGCGGTDWTSSAGSTTGGAPALRDRGRFIRRRSARW